MSKSLADILGIPTEKSDDIPTTNHKLTAKGLSKAILESEQYRASIHRRILLDTLPPAVECRLYDYAYGKPVDKVEVKDTTERLEDVSSEELEAKAMALATLARKLRRQVDSTEPITH